MSEMQLKTIALKKLAPHPLAANVMPEERQTKLAANIQHTEVYQPPVVRPNPDKNGHYQILDGASRVAALKTLGHKEAQCVVLDVDDAKAELLLATFNSLRGTENPYRRAMLVQQLTVHLPKQTLATLLPESEKQLDDLLNLLKTTQEEQQKKVKAMLEKAKATLPVCFTFLILAADAELVQQALDRFKTDDADELSKALVALAAWVVEQPQPESVVTTDTPEAEAHVG